MLKLGAQSGNSTFWHVQSGEDADAQAVERLLSPSGKLFRAMHSADADGLIKFVFPLERLPTHTQLLLTSEGGRHAAMQHTGRSLLAAPTWPSWQRVRRTLGMPGLCQG